MRPIDEVAALNWSDYKNGYFAVTKSITDGEEGRKKTEQDRLVPVHPVVMEMLEARQQVRQLRCDRVLVTQYGKGYKHTRTFAMRFSRALAESGISYRAL